jgi:hypothetical protein
MRFETHFTSVIRRAYIAHGLVLIDRPTCNLKQGETGPYRTVYIPPNRLIRAIMASWSEPECRRRFDRTAGFSNLKVANQVKKFVPTLSLGLELNL